MTPRTAAQHADVWNAAGGTPSEIAASSMILDQHCADAGRNPAEIRRSVQALVSHDVAALEPTVAGFVEVGVTDFVLIVQGDDAPAVGVGWLSCCRGCARWAGRGLSSRDQSPVRAW